LCTTSIFYQFLSYFHEICLKNLKISGNQQGNRYVPRHGCCNDAPRVGLGVRINQLDEEIVDIFAGHRLRLQEAWLLWDGKNEEAACD
jgi:hypothetical protein